MSLPYASLAYVGGYDIPRWLACQEIRLLTFVGNPDNVARMPRPRLYQSPVYPLVDRFGGVTRMGEVVFPGDPRGARRVREWVNDGMVPAWHFAAVVRAGQQAGVEVTYDELAAIAEAKRLEAA